MLRDPSCCSNPHCYYARAYEEVLRELEAERIARSKLVQYAVEKDNRINSLKGEILSCVLGRNKHTESRELIAQLVQSIRGPRPRHK